MGLVKHILARVLRKTFFWRVRIAYSLEGIDAVARALSHCSKHHIAPILARYGAHVGSDIHFKGALQIDNASEGDGHGASFSKLFIGNKAYVGRNVFFDLPNEIHIEDECVVSANVMFLTHHDCGGRKMSHWYPRQTGPVRIGSGSWIGAGAILLHGVTLGPCCVVAAGSVVRDSFPAYSVLAGSPATRVKSLEAPKSDPPDSTSTP